MVNLMHHCHPVGSELVGQPIRCDAKRERMHDGINGAGSGEGFQRCRAECATVMFDNDEHSHLRIPSSSNRSTTAGAASGPLPSMTVALACSAD